MLEQLGRSDALISDLAETFQMTLTGMKKHITALEQAGLVTSEKVGRVRTCRLGASRLEQEVEWLERYRQLWDARFDRLDKVIEDLKRKEQDNRQGNGVLMSDRGTTVTHLSDTEISATRTFDAPPRIVFQAWADPKLFAQWWVPKSLGVPLRACELDMRTGGTYRLEFGHDAENSFAFFVRYTEVTPLSSIVWTNEEGEDGDAITTVTFVEQAGQTLLTLTETYPSKQALDESLGGIEGTPEQFAQLDAVLVGLV